MSYGCAQTQHFIYKCMIALSVADVRSLSICNKDTNTKMICELRAFQICMCACALYVRARTLACAMTARLCASVLVSVLKRCLSSPSPKSASNERTRHPTPLATTQTVHSTSRHRPHGASAKSEAYIHGRPAQTFPTTTRSKKGDCRPKYADTILIESWMAQTCPALNEKSEFCCE